MMGFLEQSNIKLLNDEHVVIDGRLILVGRLDSSPIGGTGELRRKDFSEVMAQIDANLPVVVMDHNPANINQYDGDADLILSGHTHRGQLFPGSIITGLLFTADYGHYQKDPASPHLVVTQGVGTWLMPMRVGTNSEIVSIALSS
jgi:predicted MPP superfamily phosphohydrolase